MHEPRPPWDLSVYEMRAELIGLGEIGSELRFSPQQLEQLGGKAVSGAENDLRDFARLGGLTLATGQSPWRRAQITSGEEAQIALQGVEELRRTTLPNVLAALRRAATETASRQPQQSPTGSRACNSGKNLPTRERPVPTRSTRLTSTLSSNDSLPRTRALSPACGHH